MSGGGGISQPNINYQPTGFHTQGFDATFSGISSGQGQGQGGTGSPFGGGMFNLNEGTSVLNNLSKLKGSYSQQASALDALLGTVKPGFSQFRQAGLSDIETQRQANVSNLTDTMAQRRVLGSSFANDATTNANATYDQMRSNFIAQSYLQELQATDTLTQQKFDSLHQEFSAALNQYNFEAGLAAQMSSQVSQSYAQIATAEAQMKLQSEEFKAQMQMQEMMGFGQLAGGLLGGMMGGGSDIRLKENIVRVGTTVHDLPLYEFNYRGGTARYEGVMADDVLEVMPEAVLFTFGDGYLGVNYDKLGIELRRVA